MARLVVWLVVALLALSFFGISLKSLVESPVNKENIAFISQLLHQGWTMLILWLHSIIDPIIAMQHISFPH